MTASSTAAQGAHPHDEVSPQEAARAHVVDVGAALNARLSDLTRGIRDLLATRIEELSGDARLIDLLGASIEGNVDNILHALQHDISASRMEPPSAAIEYARRLAQRGVPLNALVRAYRLGQQNLLAACFAESAARTVDPAVRVLAHEHVVTLTFEYIDSISQQVVRVYEVERERWLADRNTVRASVLADLVSGAVSDVGDVSAAETALGYRLRGVAHLGLLLWASEDAGHSTDPLKVFDTTVSMLSRRFGGGRPTILLPRDSTSAWAWLSVAQAPDPAEVRQALACVPDAPQLAVGGLHTGVDGFRRTHREALQAQRVAVVAGGAGGPVLHYDAPGLGLAALMCGNLDETRDWVRQTLGPLAEDDEYHERLRETVRVLLEHGGTYVTAAEALCMHRNTVRYRINRAEAELGRPITSHRQATDVALTLCHWLGPAVLTPAAPDARRERGARAAAQEPAPVRPAAPVLVPGSQKVAPVLSGVHLGRSPGSA